MTRCALAPILAAALASSASAERTPTALSGGATTVHATGRDAFTLPAANLAPERRAAFEKGLREFNETWLPAPSAESHRDGLGPLFNAASCAACHAGGGRTDPYMKDSPAMLVRLNSAARTDTGARRGDPTYGSQIQHQAIAGHTPEARPETQWITLKGTYPDGEPYELRKPSVLLYARGYGDISDAAQTSVRTAPPVFGTGLLEAIPAGTILALADPADADGDGISGRPNLVWDIRAREKRIGRFGWKAGQPTVEQQVAAAFANDIGVTSDLFMMDDTTPAQKAAHEAEQGGVPELDADRLADITLYSETIGVPARRSLGDPQALRGEALFDAIGCAACHTPELKTGPHRLPELAHQTIRPYTDLLLHDMGAELSDVQFEFDANGREWRTPPLWGIGLTETVNGHLSLLHDGRARSFEEAILWHGGEAEGSARRFRELPKDERDALVAFLRSL